MNNILKFQHNSWTINRDHIKFKFSFKLGWGFLWLMLESWSITPTEAHGKKAPTNNCKKYIGQNKSGRSGLCLATKPYIAILLLVLSSCGNDQALLELVLLNQPQAEKSIIEKSVLHFGFALCIPLSTFKMHPKMDQEAALVCPCSQF